MGSHSGQRRSEDLSKAQQHRKDMSLALHAYCTRGTYLEPQFLIMQMMDVRSKPFVVSATCVVRVCVRAYGWR